MLRNSTEKYKKMYGTTACDSASQPTVMRYKQTLQQFDQMYSDISQPKYMNKLGRTKKTQNLTCFRHRTYYSNCNLQSLKADLEEMGRNDRKNSFYSDKINPEKLTQTRRSKLYQQSTSELEVPSRNSQDFINNMPRNSLFYCTHCFQYVFDIEKKRHFPQCKDTIPNPTNNSAQVDQGYQKLSKIVQLAKYTSTKQDSIKQLHESIKRRELESIQKIQYPKDYQFFKLEQIEWAFAHTYNRLLRGKKIDINFFGCF